MSRIRIAEWTCIATHACMLHDGATPTNVLGTHSLKQGMTSHALNALSKHMKQQREKDARLAQEREELMEAGSSLSQDEDDLRPKRPRAKPRRAKKKASNDEEGDGWVSFPCVGRVLAWVTCIVVSLFVLLLLASFLLPPPEDEAPQ